MSRARFTTTGPLVLLIVLSLAQRSLVGREADPSPLSLTPAEKAWIAAHPKVRVGIDPAWPPFSTATNGNCVGIDPDVLALIGRKLGITFEVSSGSSWASVYAAATKGELDMLGGTARTAERERAFQFTQPYFSFPVVIVTRADEPILWSVLDLAGRRVVGVRDYVATSQVAKDYPGLEFVPPADSVAQAMMMVSDHEADAFITNLPNASFVTKTHGLTNLKIAGVMPERFDLCYAVRPDWPELTALLNRAIKTITEADRQALVHPWIRVDYAKVIRWDVVWKTATLILSVLGIAFGAVIYHNRRLTRELTERTRLQGEIKSAHDELVHLNDDKTELLQMAAHDLRGPLTGMQLAIDSSLRMNALPAAEALKILEKQVRQMTGLLNDLLDVEALEHGRREFRVERLDPASSLREALAALESVRLQKEITVEVAVEREVPAVQVDPTALRQIMDNLLSNAVKFSPRGSVIAVNLKADGASVRFEVRDQGPGVAAEETERIFAKYMRGSARPTDGEKSTGLGLSIVRQLAGAMNARVWCEPRTETGGVGVFVVALPIAAVAMGGLVAGSPSGSPLLR